MSGLSRTPGKRVWDNIPPRVRIPPSPPNKKWASVRVPISYFEYPNSGVAYSFTTPFIAALLPHES